VPCSLFQEAWVHGIDFVPLAVERGLQVFERALDLDFVNLALRAAAQLVEDPRVIGGVNLLSARGGAEEAGDSVQSVFVGFSGKGCVFCVRVRLAFKGG
jgi:hypothetical protein